MPTKELPFVLAGPVLRRVSQSEMWIWVAFSKAVDVEYKGSTLQARLYETAKTPMAKGALIEASEALCIGRAEFSAQRKENVGFYFNHLENLHVYLLKIVPTHRGKPFPPNRLLSYELFVTETVRFKNEKGGWEDREIHRGLHEHLYAKPDEWRGWRNLAANEENDTSLPPGLRGYFDSHGGFNGWNLSRHTPASSASKSPPDFLQPELDVKFLRDYRKLWSQKISAPTSGIASALPCTVIAGPKIAPVLWSGSCYKLGGVGSPATLLMFDDRTSEQNRNKTSSNERPKLIEAIDGAERGEFPQSLVLTGDQIYADDVTFTLSESVSVLARLLESSDEQVENIPDLRKLGASERKTLVGIGNNKTPFTVDGTDNHLLAFSEYCAYYLLHMNAALWPKLGDANLRKSALGRRKAALHELNPIRRAYEMDDEFFRLQVGQISIRSYSIVQSCVATYALCDDHEVTDDWFMDEKWMRGLLDPAKKFRVDSKEIKEIEHSEIGCRIVANAIHSYALMQGVGNDPARFAVRLNQMSDLRSGIQRSKSPSEPREYFRLLRILEQGDWTFEVPLSIGKAICLDTRTQRLPYAWLEKALEKGAYKSDFYGTKDVMDKADWVSSERTYRRDREAIDWSDNWSIPVAELKPVDDAIGFDTLLFRNRNLIGVLSKLNVTQPLVIFTPGPVCAIDEVESTKRLAPWKSKYEVDAELWRNNLSNFYRLADLLISSSVTNCVLISGDVHYAFRRNVYIAPISSMLSKFKEVQKLGSIDWFNSRKSPVNRKLLFQQVVSSALKNYSDDPVIRRGASPGGDALQVSTKYISFRNSPKKTVSVNTEQEWDSSPRNYVETTEPLKITEKDSPSKGRSSDEDDYYLFENNFVVIRLPRDSDGIVRAEFVSNRKQ